MTDPDLTAPKSVEYECRKIHDAITRGAIKANDGVKWQDTLRALSAALEAERVHRSTRRDEAPEPGMLPIPSPQQCVEDLRDDGFHPQATCVERLMREASYHQQELDGMVTRLRREQSRAEALDAKLKKAVEFLKWYGCQKNWTTENPYEECGIDLDEGSRARAFLASLEGDKP